jgi:hypothetical protein
MAKPPASGPAGASSERSRRWNSRQQVAQWHRGRGVVRRRLEHGGVEEHRERIAGHVRGERAARARLVVLTRRGSHQRQHVEVEKILHRALGGGVEEAQRLDLVAEELQAHRPLARGREDVHDAAAEAPLADLHDRLRHARSPAASSPAVSASRSIVPPSSRRSRRGAVIGGLQQRRGQRGGRGPPPPRAPRAGGDGPPARASRPARRAGCPASPRPAAAGTRAPGARPPPAPASASRK